MIHFPLLVRQTLRGILHKFSLYMATHTHSTSAFRTKAVRALRGTATHQRGIRSMVYG